LRRGRGGIREHGQGIVRRRPGRDRLAEGPGRRLERVDHGLVALARGPQPLHAGQRRVQRGGQPGQVHVGGVAQRLPGPAERHAVQRPGRAAHLGDDGAAGQGQDPSGRHVRRGPVARVQRAEHRGEAAVQVDAVIGVADRRVQLGQVITVGLDDPGGRRYPGPEDFSVHRGSLAGDLRHAF